jgi:hypothetical protein
MARRKKTASEVAPKSVPPPRGKAISGLKHVGLEVCLHGGAKYHFAAGAKWRWARVLDEVFLEVLGGDGAVLLQAHRSNVLVVTGDTFTTPLMVTREYPLPG